MADRMEKREQLRQLLKKQQIDISAHDIAVIGLGGRYPKAETLDDFWDIIRNGKRCIEEIPKDRWEANRYFDADPKQAVTGKMTCKWGGFLDDVYAFDPSLFHMTAEDAAVMDPQIRLLLETAWATVEDAGYPALVGYPRNIGVFVGATTHTYDDLLLEEHQRGKSVYPLANPAALASRLAHFFNLTGPCLPVDTECSSSLTAIHLACQSLKNNECDMALAGGVNLYLHPSKFIGLSCRNMVSHDDKHRSFGKGGTGFVPGEGVGAVLLKPLARAVRDGDPIHGVIKGSRINNWGKSVMYMSPNPVMQTDLIVRTLKDTGIEPGTLSYIEAQGLGSDVADTTEVLSLTEAFRHFGEPGNPCPMGAVKPNIGHPESASGMAQLTKVLLQLKHKQLAPTLGSDEPNPNIDFDHSPVYLQRELAQWPRPVRHGNGSSMISSRRAGIVSFGSGGTGACLIVEEFEPIAFDPESSGPVIFVLSAANTDRLNVYTRLMVLWLKKTWPPGTAPLARIAYTLQTGRTPMQERLSAVVSGQDELIEKLEQYCQGAIPVNHFYTGTQGKHPSPQTAKAELDDPLCTLARGWVSNEDLDWSALYTHGTPSRISLPAYPFEKKICRLSGSTDSGSAIPWTGANVYPLTGAESDEKHGPTETGNRAGAMENVRSIVHHSMAMILQIKPEDIDNSLEFGALGFTSRTLTQLAGRLNEQLKLSLTPTVFYRYPHVNALADHLVRQYPGAFIHLSQESPVQPVSSVKREQQNHKSAFPTQKYEDTVRPEPIAIIGISGRFPLADDPDEFWKNLVDGRHCITEVPADRWDWKTLDSNHSNTDLKWGGFITGIGEFDPLFFGISPSEAQVMDPQQRLLMMYIWNVIEDAGYSAQSLSGTQTGIFAATFANDYADLLSRSNFPMDGYAATSMVPSMGPNRMSFFLNVHGPSEPVETACSSSLVAVHRAVTAIHTGQCSMAIAGGVNTMASPFVSMANSKAGMLSPDGICKTFSEKANGYVRGEGVGMLFLKRLSDAEQDRDHIYGIIRSTAENHGGRANSLTSPNSKAQAELLKTAYRKAGLDPRTIGYIETHGTGTKLGDPAEIQGLKEAFSDLYQEMGNPVGDTAHCGLGSVKTNIGHLELAAGVTGIIKVLLQIKHRTLVKSLHSEPLNPYIDLDGSPFYIANENREWTALCDASGHALPRRAGVSSFGLGGVNAHVVLEEYTGLASTENHEDPPRFCLPVIVPLSAKNDVRLKEQARRLLNAITTHCLTDRDLPRIAYTLQVGRDAMDERLAVLAASVKDLEDRLKVFIRDTDQAMGYGLYRGQVKKTGDALKVFDTDDDLHHAVQSWIDKGKFDTIGGLWVKGLDVDWNALYGEVRPQRISLPTYPFEKTRYWVPESTRDTQTDNHAPIVQSLQEKVFCSDDKEACHQNQAIHLRDEDDHKGVMTASSGEAATVQSKGRRPDMAGFTVSQCIEWDVKEQIGQLLKIDPNHLSVDENLTDFGFDSMSLTKFATRLMRLYDIDLTPAVFFGYATIKELTRFLFDSHEQTMRSYYAYPEAVPVACHVQQEAAVTSKQKTDRRSFSASKSCMDPSEPIAIIGMSGRFPDARTINDLWEILLQGKDTVREIPPARFDWLKFASKEHTWTCGCVPGVDEFDPLFFEISPREARTMDPRQRLLLQEAWNALEDAGYGAKELAANRIGAFVGVEQNNFKEITRDPHHITSNHNAVLASRLSYFLNLSGPVLSINTACSSGLVAAHQACQSLRNKECDTALAAGVNLILNPAPHIAMEQAGMLSKTGRCYAFDQRANGMTPGEAVTVIVLKRLSRALEQKDPIYAVIRGSGINYDGKTNGITAPSGVAQTELIRSVWERYGISPQGIDYIVTHGTGTLLGDPVEINALHDAFGSYSEKPPLCAITSTKSNFGHSLAASGLVSLISLVQAMRHNTIPVSLHCVRENVYMNWKESPFFVNKANKPWPANGKKRMGAVSAFGLSGTNVHMVIEDPPATSQDITGRLPCTLLCFSAKTPEGVQQKIRDLMLFLNGGEKSVSDLYHTAYTLIKGRHHFRHRCAVIIRDHGDVLPVLEKTVSRKKLPNIFWGQVPGDFTPQRVIVSSIENLIKTSHLLYDNAPEYQEIMYALAEFYCQGYPIDADTLYQDVNLLRIHLPGYPFKRERFPLPESVTGMQTSGAEKGPGGLHPLVHRNTSNFQEQRFSSDFDGREFFLTDHVVRSRQILPGVAYLEMSRAALGIAAGVSEDSGTGICLKNIVWARPLVIGKDGSPVTIHMSLFPDESQAISWEIFSKTEDGASEPVVYCQGRGYVRDFDEEPVRDISALKSACNHGRLSSQQCYSLFSGVGLEYGPAHQGIEDIYLGSDQVLARLTLPASVADTKNQFVLHPSMMDSALQATMGLTINDAAFHTAFLPFTLKQLDILKPCTETMWAHVRSMGVPNPADNMRRFDIDLMDGQGNLCVRMGELTSVCIEDKIEPLYADGDQRALLFEPVFHGQPLCDSINTQTYESHLVIACEWEGLTVDAMAHAGLKNTRCLDLTAGQESVAQRFSAYAVRVFEEIQRIFQSRPQGQVLVQVLVPMQGEKQVFTGLSGLLKTARLENPRFIGQLIEIQPDTKAKQVIEQLSHNSQVPLDHWIRYQNGQRLVAGWKEMTALSKAPGRPWTDKGVYLITGGAGGLGLMFAREIASKVHHATVILTGRSALDDMQKENIRNLSSNALIEYRQADVTEHEAVLDLIRDIQAEHGGLNGIIHSAGVIADNYILKKTVEDVARVLAPKVKGLTCLDEATQDIPLDFFIVFSSVAGALGNPGQADYACANAFMDGYAAYRNTLVLAGKRQGHTVAMDWPLWEEGGMHVDPASIEMIKQINGLKPMPTHTGMAAFYHSLALRKNRMMILVGDHELMKKKLISVPVNKTVHPHVPPVFESEVSFETLKKRIVSIVSEILDVHPEDIDSDCEFIGYGFDSITLVQLANRLNLAYDLELTPALFFEYPTIQGFAHYLLQSHGACLAKPLDIKTDTAQSVLEIPSPDKKILIFSEISVQGVKRFKRHSGKTNTRGAAEPVAVIGMSGRFPMADNLDQFWQNLLDGRHCITDIPKERWDWREINRDFSEKSGQDYVNWGGFVNGLGDFDPLFFGISPKEAALMDPQQRLLMMSIWEAMEDAGYCSQTLSGTPTAIFAACNNIGYSERLHRHEMQAEAYSSTGMMQTLGPNRMSWFLNMHGPSEPVDTACSSSLVAIHKAMTSISSGECDMAFAGGVNTILSPLVHISYCKAGMLSRDGRCKTFSDQADGYVRAEGVGMLFLKRLTQAESDGDPIYGVLLSSAENHGGRSNALTAPNAKAQGELLTTAYRRSGIDPGTVGYIEAHGTGTALGDPVEINALKAAFSRLYKDAGKSEDVEPHCGLGSVKTNVGHLELASGIAGVIKVLLQMKHKTLVKSLHCETINPYIKLEKTPFYINRDTRPWQSIKDGQGNDLPRRAGISSFGVGGVNAHVVMEEYLAPASVQKDSTPMSTDNPAAILLSAKDEDRLKEQVRRLGAMIKKQSCSDDDLPNIAYTLQTGRDAMDHRLGMLVNSITDLENKLQMFIYEKPRSFSPEIFPNVFYQGNIRRNKDVAKIFETDDDLQKLSDTWTRNNKPSKLIALWVKGMNFDWNTLYNEDRPRRIHLPVYPFKKERYWLPEPVTGAQTLGAEKDTRGPHPVLHRNTSSVSIEDKMEHQSTLETMRSILIDSISNIVGVDINDVDCESELREYGFDSISLTVLANRLNKTYNLELTPDLFVEYQTIERISHYLIQTYGEQMNIGVNNQTETSSLERVSAGSVNNSSMSRKHKSRSEGKSVTHLAEPIAIIGMSGRFPMADHLDVFWKNLVEGKNCITEIPKERWNWREHYHPNSMEAAALGKSCCKWGGFLQDFDRFDPLFFHMSPKDALRIDPQERLFLEECWRAFEDSGYVQASLDEELRQYIGVFCGITKNGFGLWNHGGSEFKLNTSFASLVNRVSHYMNFSGPSLAVDSMCSSALVAVHQACESLRKGDIHLALAGSVNLNLHPLNYAELSQFHIISDSATGTILGKDSHGFIPSEGVGVIILKRLADARKDRDTILAVIKGSAVNHNGRTEAFMVPDPKSQANVIKKALDVSGIEPWTVGYIELAASGVPMGDVSEMKALVEAYGRDQENTNDMYRMGSLKSLQGHGEAFSGMAQLMKVVMQLRHKTICPTRVAEHVNPGIDFNRVPFTIQAELGTWTQLEKDGRTYPRRAGINSFGAGGVNVHLIVEDYSEDTETPRETGNNVLVSDPALFVLSAKTPKVLSIYAHQWKLYLENHGDMDLARLCHTLQIHREAMKYRMACVAHNIPQLISCLEAFISEIPGAYVCTGKRDLSRPDQRVLPHETEADHMIGQAISTHNGNHLAQLWAHGARVPWSQLYTGHAYKPLIGLPTYPFAGKRCPISPFHSMAEAGKPVYHGDPSIPKKYQTIPEPIEKKSVMPHPREIPVLPEQAPAWEQKAKSGLSLTLGKDHQRVVKTIRETLNKIILTDDDDLIDFDANFGEIGLTSLTIIEFVNELNMALDLDLPENIVFEYPDSKQLTEYIVSLPATPQGDRDTRVNGSNQDEMLDSVLRDVLKGNLSVDAAIHLIES
ncbi:MAG: SDR family NAD(P)-dependent oxidoreductase [Proteobacteria bacterium]|nr:SDR family NAD(P)-dependent oxidoreductase [Pseudomonadota bacterium]